MDPDAEAGQDHADFGELRREAGVRDEARREGPDGDAGEEVADERRETQARREEAEHEREPEPGGEDGDERGVVGHGLGRPSGRRPCHATCADQARGRLLREPASRVQSARARANPGFSKHARVGDPWSCVSTHESTPTIDELLAHADWVRRLARELVRDEQRADDVVQETWLAALRSPPRTAENVRGWLARVAHNAARGLARSERVRSAHEKRAARHEATTDEIAARAGVQRDLVDRVLALGEPYRSVLLLVYFEQLSTADVARRLRVPEATVRTRRARGLELLRVRLASDHEGRASWCLAFAELAREPGVGGGTAGAGLGVGVGVFSLTKWKLVAAAAVVFAFGTFWLASRANESSPFAASDASPLASMERERELALSPALEARERAAAASVASDASSDRASGSLRARGRILDASGAPVAGIAIKQLPNGAPRARGPGTPPNNDEGAALDASPAIVADAEGRFALTTSAGSVRAALSSLRVSQPGWVQLGAGTRFDAEGRDELIVVVAPSERVTGVVVDDGGRPLAGIDVEPRLAFMWMPGFPLVLENPLAAPLAPKVHTDDAGAFEITGLPRVPTLSLTVRAVAMPLVLDDFADAHVEPFAPGAERPLRVVLHGETTARISDRALERALRRPWLSIAGRVVAHDGTPARAHVLFHSTRTETAADGSFGLEVPGFDPAHIAESVASGAPAQPGELDLVAVGRGSQPAIVREFALRAGEAGVNRDLVLQLGPPTLTIRGRVLGADGAPRTRVHVGLAEWTRSQGQELESLLASDTDERETTTDANGEFVVGGLLPRTYRLHALDLVDGNEVTSDPILAGAEHVELRLQSCAWIEAVHGIVVSRDGRPVRGATVRVESGWPVPGGGTRAYTLGEVVADAEGRFVLARAPSCGEIRVSGENVGECRAPLDEFTRETEWRIVAPRTVRFVVRTTAGDAATGFKVLDERGRALRVSDNRIDGTHMSESVQLVDGASGVCLVDDDAKEIALFAGPQELRRIPIALDYESVQTIVP